MIEEGQAEVVGEMEHVKLLRLRSELHAAIEDARMVASSLMGVLSICSDEIRDLLALDRLSASDFKVAVWRAETALDAWRTSAR